MPKRNSVYLFMALNILALLPLSTYFMIGNDAQNRNYDITDSKAIFASIRAGKPFEILQNGNTVDYTQALKTNTSNLNPYEPIFGYFLENFHPEVKPGSIWEISDGTFNMSDPTGYVFPEINHSRPFARIPVSEKDKLEIFVKHLNPNWEIPISQQILDWISLISSIAASLFFSYYLLQQFWKRFKVFTPPPKPNG